MIPAAIRSTSQIADKPIKCVTYGKSGVGKTCLAATAPAPLIIDSERGTLSLAREEIAVWPVSTLGEARAALAWLRTDPEARETFKTVVVDSLTDLAEKFKADFLASGDPRAKDPRAAYGETSDQMQAFMRELRDLPFFDVVAIAKQEPREDEVSKVTLWGPAMPGAKLANSVAYLFDCVFHLRIKQDKSRRLLTAADFQFDAKNRLGVLAPEEPADLTHIFNKIRGVNIANNANGAH